MSANELVDGRYYQVAAPRSLGERLVIAARDRILDDFMRLCRPRPDDTVIDIGVSDVVNDAANVMARRYPHRRNITAVGLGEGSHFRAAFPDIAYRRIEANRPLPFPDRQFDFAVSNAVLEHVGSRDHQAVFVREMTRVARKVFISVPNRYFPIEHHTAIPFLHYWDASFAFACDQLGKSEWTRAENLILMTRDRLAALVPAGARIGYTGLRLGPLSSNLFAAF